jgi:hypothetical protein
MADDPDGNIRHIAEHGLTQDDVEDVLLAGDSSTTTSRSSGEQITLDTLPMAGTSRWCGNMSWMIH